MKKILVAVAIISVFLITACYEPPQTGQTKSQQIKKDARSASVMPMFYRPCLEISLVAKETKEPELEDVIKKQVLEILEEERKLLEEMEKSKIVDYESYLTSISVYGHESKSGTAIPIGSLEGIPTWAKFPERVLTVYKIETKEIKEWEKEYESDVLTISETADVSPTKAKGILSQLRSAGYSVSKDEVVEDSEIELIYFSTGWSDSFPTTLRWSVKLSGTDGENLIIGYDPRGIILTKPIPDDKRVDVETSYIDLEEWSKPKPTRELALEAELKQKEQRINELYEQMAELIDVPEYKYDIRNATYRDVMMGMVTVNEFWMMSGGSGVFLGNMDVVGDRNKYTISYRGHGSRFAETEMNGVVLTNNHVVDNALKMEVMISADEETMWIIYPGIPYVRYTHTSDRMGTPAAVLWFDGEPVASPSVDAALLVTTPIPGYSKHAAILGNSDNVKDGTRIVSVGNPGLMHKFLTEGSISNSNYNMFQSPMVDYIQNLGGGYGYDSIVNDSMWIDPPIAMGGVSGSGVFALEGSEKGKVIGLRNAGLNMRFSDYIISSMIPVDHNSLTIAYEAKVSEVKYEKIEDIFTPLEDVKFINSTEQMDGFMEAVKLGGYMPISGMSICIPINKVKAWLIERGIDMGFEQDMDDDRWTQ